MILVIGTPDSGKSSYAEALALEIFGEEKRAYIATMIPYGKEGIERVDKHRRLREGKDFVTYEKPSDIYELVDVLAREKIDNALLECVSNLVGNEIYSDKNKDMSDEALTDVIVSEIHRLDDSLKNLIVVTNEFEGSSEYDEETNRYIRIQALVNARLKALSKKYIVKEKGDWVIHENN